MGVDSVEDTVADALADAQQEEIEGAPEEPVTEYVAMLVCCIRPLAHRLCREEQKKEDLIDIVETITSDEPEAESEESAAVFTKDA